MWTHTISIYFSTQVCFGWEILFRSGIWDILFLRDCKTELQRYPYVQMYVYGGMKVGQQLGHVFRLYSNTTRARLGTRLLSPGQARACVLCLGARCSALSANGNNWDTGLACTTWRPGQSGPWTPLQAQARWHITLKVPSNELEDYPCKWLIWFSSSWMAARFTIRIQITTVWFVPYT